MTKIFIPIAHPEYPKLITLPVSCGMGLVQCLYILFTQHVKSLIIFPGMHPGVTRAEQTSLASTCKTNMKCDPAVF